jgi:hypothetical protein
MMLAAEPHNLPHGGLYKVQYRRLRIIDAEGKVYWNLFPPLGTLTVPVRGDVPPGSSLTAQGQIAVGLTPNHYRVRTGEPLSLDIAVQNLDPAEAQHVQLSVRLQGEGKPVALVQNLALDLAPGETRTITRPVSPPLPPGNYTALADVTVGTRAATFHSLALTVAEAPSPLPAVDQLRTGNWVAWGMDVINFPNLPTLAELRQDGGNYANIFIPWGEVERRPGEYNFSNVDRLVADAARANLRAEVFFITAGGDFPPAYRQEAMVDQHGQPLKGNPLALSYWAPTARPAFMKMVAATVQHYRANPTVVAYQFTYGGWGDAFYGKARDGSLSFTDYSPYSQAKFREYVRTVLKLWLPEAAARYGLPLAGWDDLRQPEPVEGIDLRPIWWDFQNYRVWSVEQMWDDVCATVRRYDSARLIELDYGGSQEATGWIANDYDMAARVARQYGASIHNTCYEGYSAAPLLGTFTREWGLRHTCETAGTPAPPDWHQQGMFNLCKYGARGYYWIQGASPVVGVYPSYAQLRPVVEELADARPVGKRLGMLQSISLYQCNLREAGLELFPAARFAQQAGFTADLYTDRSWLGGGHRLDPFTMPVLIDYGSPVLTAPAADAVAAYVRAGGTAILFPQSGRFTPGNPSEQYRLLTALGLTAAAGLAPGTGTETARTTAYLPDLSLRLSQPTPLAGLPAGSEIWAQFASGQPALASWPCGHGQVYLFGGMPDLSDQETVSALTALTVLAGVSPPAAASGGIETAVLEKGATRYVVLHNPSPATVDTRLTVDDQGPRRVYDLVNRQALGATSAHWPAEISLQLRPLEVTVLALDRPSAPRRTFPTLDYPLPATTQMPMPPPDLHHYLPLNAWLVTGPFANPDWFNGASFYLPRAPEQGWDPAAVYTEAGRRLRWTPYQAQDGALRLTDLYPFDTKTLAYAMTDLVAPTACTVRLRLGTDYAMYLWLNGQPLFDSNALSHGSQAGEFTLEVPLHAGRNRLSGRLAPGSAGWALFAQVSGPGGLQVVTPVGPASISSP